MRARRIIEGASFGPDVLQVVQQAFDEAWAAVADRFTSHEHEVAREALALAMISATREDSADVARLRDAGTRALKLKFPSRFADDVPPGRDTKTG